MDDEIETIAKRVIGAAIQVHKVLGPGLLESAYAACLAIELKHLGIAFEREVPLPIHYRDQLVDAAYRLDFLIEGRVILELKFIAQLEAMHTAQVMTYLRLTGHKLALLINFNVPLLRDGIKRVIL